MQAGRQSYCLFDTSLGPCGVAWSNQGLTRLQLPEADRCATERRLAAASRAPDAPSPSVEQAIASIQRYLAGENVAFDALAVDLGSVSAFHRKVYAAARAVGWGQTTTYGALAKQIGSPDASRAIGQAMGSNPVPIIIPCHRVLAAGRKIGGFSAFGGATTKEWLLALEGVSLGDATPLLPGLLPERR
jgi:methylated-DNA-[protein]-cysteine S-methyltransferase